MAITILRNYWLSIYICMRFSLRSSHQVRDVRGKSKNHEDVVSKCVEGEQQRDVTIGVGPSYKKRFMPINVIDRIAYSVILMDQTCNHFLEVIFTVIEEEMN